jgi:beta-lactamase regulating signal transducer with metallopeptidase domain
MSDVIFGNLTSYALNAAWLTAVLGAAVWCIARCFRRAGLELQHKLWVTALFLAIILPATPLLPLFFSPSAKLDSGTISGNVPTDFLSGDPAGRGSDLILPTLMVHVISALYLGSLLFFVLRLGWMIHSAAALLRRARPVFSSGSTEFNSTALWNQATETFSTPNAVLMRSTDITAPVTAGFRRQVLLLPDTFMENHSQAEFLTAVGHECAHIQRRDFGKNVFYEIASLFTAFHPATWFIKSQIAQTREMICDQLAADRLQDRQSYAQSLLKLAGKVPQAEPHTVPVMGIFDTNILERRIMNLTTSLPTASKARRYGSGLIAALLLLGFAGGAGLLAKSVVTQNSTLVKFLGERLGRVDLSCTFYGYTNKVWGGSAGTCWIDMKKKKSYICYRNDHPEQNQSQIGCEWKVQRAQAAGK